MGALRNVNDPVVARYGEEADPRHARFLFHHEVTNQHQGRF
jgi:hypothetical protein